MRTEVAKKRQDCNGKEKVLGEQTVATTRYLSNQAMLTLTSKETKLTCYSGDDAKVSTHL